MAGCGAAWLWLGMLVLEGAAVSWDSPGLSLLVTCPLVWPGPPPPTSLLTPRPPHPSVLAHGPLTAHPLHSGQPENWSSSLLLLGEGSKVPPARPSCSST